MTTNTTVVQRGDSFDIGTPSGTHDVALAPEKGEDIIIKALSNPGGLIESLNLTEAQKKNVQAVLAGAGAGLGLKFLSDALGEEISAAIGAVAGAYVAKKVIKRSRI